ncbi:VirB4 family type IV secretion system protein [Klebsiella pneumoniae]
MRGEQSKNVFSPESKKVPWLGHHVHPNVCTLGNSHLLALLRFKGVPHETRDKETLNREFKRLDRCIKALGKQEGKNLMLQTYTFKTGVRLDAHYKMEIPILQDFVDEYTAPFRCGAYQQVGYGMGLILKHSDLEEGIASMVELLSICQEMLSDYSVAVMGMEERNGKLYSQVGRFYSFIFNGVDQDVPVTDTRLGDSVINGETGFGAYDYVECRPYNSAPRFATTYDLRDYPDESEPGMWDQVLEEQYDFTLVQTFHFEDRNKIKTKINAQKVDLASTEGESSQTEELEDDVQAVTQGKRLFGHYHSSLIVYGETPEKAVNNGARMQALFLALNTGFVRSTSTNIDSWLTLFPAYTDVIYRYPKSTENLACGFSLHATPTGKATGNPPGDGTALMPLKTVQGGLFFLNAHDSPPGQNNTGQAFPGHMVNHAQTGAGKSSSAALKMIFFSRWNPMIFGIDYNNSMENIHRALNVKYYSIEPGVYTGIQLFQLPDSNELRQLLFDTVKQCAGGADSNEETIIKSAIDAVMKHRVHEERRFSLLIQSIPDTGGNGLRARLSKWCTVNGKKGQYAWVLDSPRNLFYPEKYRRLAFDCTHILKKSYVANHPLVVEVMLNTFYFLKSSMHAKEPGCLMINQISEYWVQLAFESTAAKIEEILLAGRMRGELLLLDTQTPESALNTSSAPAMIQQIVTQEWMANDKANLESYSKFGVTAREFEKISELTPYSRQMMIKQGSGAVMVSLALNGRLEYYIPLLSATMKNLPVAERVRKKLGTDDPAIWVPHFLDEMVAFQVREDLKTDDAKVWYPEFLAKMKEYGRDVVSSLVTHPNETESESTI